MSPQDRLLLANAPRVDRLRLLLWLTHRTWAGPSHFELVVGLPAFGYLLWLGQTGFWGGVAAFAAGLSLAHINRVLTRWCNAEGVWIQQLLDDYHKGQLK